MSINVSEVIWTIINFIVLFLLLNHFLYKPVVRFMDARKARIQAGLDEEAQAQQALQDCQAQLQQELSQQHQQSQKMISEAKKEARAQCAEMYREANAAAQSQLKALNAQIEQEKHAQYVQLQAHMPELVAMLADRLLQDQSVSEKHQQVIRETVESAQTTG